MHLATTAKQHIYQRMLMKVTDYRGLGSLEVVSDEARLWLRELALQADLLHGIPSAIVDSNVTDQDVTFLNRHAQYYLTSAHAEWINYRLFKVLIHQLYALVATQRPSDLTWPGPDLDDVDRRMLGLTPEGTGS